jgi:hypothetical protein
LHRLGRCNVPIYAANMIVLVDVVLLTAVAA